MRTFDDQLVRVRAALRAVDDAWRLSAGTPRPL
jgi:hypothetical protein